MMGQNFLSFQEILLHHGHLNMTFPKFDGKIIGSSIASYSSESTHACTHIHKSEATQRP